MKKLLYIPFVLFALSALVNWVLYTLYLFGWVVEANDGSAALCFIHFLVSLVACNIFWDLAQGKK